MPRNDSYAGTGSGTLSRYRAPVTLEDKNMKDGSARGRKPAKSKYGGSANVKQSDSRSFQKKGKSGGKGKSKGY